MDNGITPHHPPCSPYCKRVLLPASFQTDVEKLRTRHWSGWRKWKVISHQEAALACYCHGFFAKQNVENLEKIANQTNEKSKHANAKNNKNFCLIHPCFVFIASFACAKNCTFICCFVHSAKHVVHMNAHFSAFPQLHCEIHPYFHLDFNKNSTKMAINNY